MTRRKTESERLFEAFCESAGIKAEPVPCDDQRTPDYLLTLGDQLVVAEVKQFDPNPEERRGNAALERGEAVALGGTPGDRIRKAIHKAVPQLKRLTEERLPGVLVVCDNSGVRLHTDPYAVATAMQGLDVVDLRTSEAHPGPEKMLTAGHNTTVSAIAVLGRGGAGELRLDVFHNRHAKNPLAPDLLRRPQVGHWQLKDGGRSSLAGWDPL